MEGVPSYTSDSGSSVHCTQPASQLNFGRSTIAASVNATEELILLDRILPDAGTSTDIEDSKLANGQQPGQSCSSSIVCGISGQDSDDGITLIYGKHEKLPWKDFSTEVRAWRDVEEFLHRTVLILDLTQCSVEEIIEGMLQKLLQHEDITFSLEGAKRAVFTQSSVHVLSKTIQGSSEGRGFDYDQSWICALCELPALSRRHVVISRLNRPANLGRTSQEIHFVILVLAPTKEKSTKTAMETGRTFATLFADLEFRQHLLQAYTEDEFKRLLWERAKQLVQEQTGADNRSRLGRAYSDASDETGGCPIGRGVREDLKRRIPHYLSDYKDGVIGHKTPQKAISAIIFLYFSCVLPNIAFGMLNDTNTHGVIGVKKVFISQCVGGIVFGVIGGQPLMVLLTTAPLAIYTKVIYSICEDFGLNFSAMFACVGIWNSVFVLLFSLFDLSKLMKWSTRSTEEIFSLFISMAFMADAVLDTLRHFDENYNSPACKREFSTLTSTNSTQPSSSVILTSLTNMSSLFPDTTSIAGVGRGVGGSEYSTAIISDNSTNTTVVEEAVGLCLKEKSLLFLLLMMGTLWVSVTMYNFTKTPFLNASKREMLADYALPVAVLSMAFFGSYVFRDVKMDTFHYEHSEAAFTPAALDQLSMGAILAAAGLGLCLSLLFFMDQNITSAVVNAPSNKLKKGAAFHWDLLVIALINGTLSLFTLPWIHAALPHSPLHVRALADVEDRVDQGHVYQIVARVRETRLTSIISHIMIGLSLLLLPYPLAYIPRPVLDGLFLYLAITALYGNQMFDRILLLVTEQSAYPPNHYVRRVPQRKVHLFTVMQLLQLLVLCIFGFSPISYMKMVFPVLLLFLMPIRHKFVTRFIEKKYLKYLDAHTQH